MVRRRTSISRIAQLLLFGLMASQAARAAITMVQFKGTNQNTVSTLAVSFTSSTTAGNLLIACFAFSSTVTFQSISDTQGNTFTQFGTEVLFSPKKLRCYYASSILGGADSVTITVSANSGLDLYIHEVSGVQKNSSPLDQGCTATSTTSPVSCSVTTYMPNEILFAVCYSNGNATAGSGFTTDVTNNNNITEHEIVSTRGTYTISATLNGANVILFIAGTFHSPFFVQRKGVTIF